MSTQARITTWVLQSRDLRQVVRMSTGPETRRSSHSDESSPCYLHVSAQTCIYERTSRNLMDSATSAADPGLRLTMRGSCARKGNWRSSLEAQQGNRSAGCLSARPHPASHPANQRHKSTPARGSNLEFPRARLLAVTIRGILAVDRARQNNGRRRRGAWRSDGVIPHAK